MYIVRTSSAAAAAAARLRLVPRPTSLAPVDRCTLHPSTPRRARAARRVRQRSRPPGRRFARAGLLPLRETRMAKAVSSVGRILDAAAVAKAAVHELVDALHADPAADGAAVILLQRRQVGQRGDAPRARRSRAAARAGRLDAALRRTPLTLVSCSAERRVGSRDGSGGGGRGGRGGGGCGGRGHGRVFVHPRNPRVVGDRISVFRNTLRLLDRDGIAPRARAPVKTQDAVMSGRGQKGGAWAEVGKRRTCTRMQQRWN